MFLREEFIFRIINEKQSVIDVCKMFNISRKTAYKWINHYQEDGIVGLQDLSRRPLVSSNRIAN